MPRRAYYPHPYGYPNYPYIKYPQFKDTKYFAMDAEEQKSQIISGIAKVIVDNKQELKDKLVQLGLACSCTIDEMKEKDLSDAIIDNISDKELRLWLAKKIAGDDSTEYKNAGADPVTAIASAIGNIFQFGTTAVGAGAANKARKDEYKNQITSTAVNYRAQKEGGKSKEKTTNTLMIAGAALLLLGIGAWIYYGATKVPKPQIA